MSSVAPHDDVQAPVNGVPVLRPRLADRIARLQSPEHGGTAPAPPPQPPAWTGELRPDEESAASADTVAGEQHAIEAASRLVSLIAEQRSLLERMQQVAATAPPAPVAPPPSLPPALSFAPPPAAPPVRPAPAEDERPPMIIERAQAEHRSGGIDRAQRPEPSRLPGFAVGFGIAMAVGVILYLARAGG